MVIEKHTYARVISDEFEAVDVEGGEFPDKHGPSWHAAETRALSPGVFNDQRKKRRIQAGVIAGGMFLRVCETGTKRYM